MKTILLLILVNLFFALEAKPDWVELENYPANNSSDLIEKNGVLYSGSASTGVYVSYDNGLSWVQRNTGFENSNALRIHSLAYLTPGLFAATTDGIYKSTNDGLNWIKKSTGIQIGPGAIYIFAYSLFEDNGALFAGTFNAIYKSTDNGDNWVPITPVVLHMDICTFHRYDNLLMAGTSAGNRVPLITSTNNGLNWSNMSINGGFPTGAFCIYSEPGKIFVGTAIGVWVSTNSGANWFKRDNGLGADPYVFSFVKVNNTLFAATNNWVYKTTNDGLNWILTNFSGQTFQDVDKLLYYNNKLYAAAYTGIWVNTDDIVTGIENPSNEIPAAYKLLQNYPNPFNPSTKIEYQIPSQSNVILKVYDFTGKEVQTLVNEIKSAGKYSLDFNASSLSSGVYFYKLETESFSSVKKMTVIK
jgi:hypothetical protein